MKEQMHEILMNLNRGRIAVSEAQEQLLDLFCVSGSAIADLNHIAINSAMNIQGLTDNESTIQEECGKIINAVRVLSKHYR